MSHCTTFRSGFADEALAVEAFKALGLSPYTGIVTTFSSEIQKRLYGALGLVTREHGRAIIAARGEYQYFLIKTGDDYQLAIEHPDLNTARLAIAQRMQSEFQLAYLGAAFARLAQQLDDSGQPHSLARTPEGWLLRFGPDLSRSVRATIALDGTISEEVEGVTGPACTDLTGFLEDLLCAPGGELNTTWKPAYYEQTEDAVMQVLRLA